MSSEPTGPREASQANLALVLGILSVAGLPLLGPAAWAIARDEMKGIDGGLRSPATRGTAGAARVLGIVGTILLVAAVTLGLFLMITKGPEIIRGIAGRPPAEVLEAALGRLAETTLEI